MNALSKIHAALRPRGLLLNIHPEASHCQIEVCVGGQTIPLGPLDESRRIHDVLVTRAALQTCVRAGQFVVERETRFTFVAHFDAVDTFLAFMAKHAPKSVIPPQVSARARALLPAGTVGEIRRVRELYAARLRRG